MTFNFWPDKKVAPFIKKHFKCSDCTSELSQNIALFSIDFKAIINFAWVNEQHLINLIQLHVKYFVGLNLQGGEILKDENHHFFVFSVVPTIVRMSDFGFSVWQFKELEKAIVKLSKQELSVNKPLYVCWQLLHQAKIFFSRNG